MPGNGADANWEPTRTDAENVSGFLRLHLVLHLTVFLAARESLSLSVHKRIYLPPGSFNTKLPPRPPQPDPVTRATVPRSRYSRPDRSHTTVDYEAEIGTPANQEVPNRPTVLARRSNSLHFVHSAPFSVLPLAILHLHSLLRNVTSNRPIYASIRLRRCRVGLRRLGRGRPRASRPRRRWWTSSVTLNVEK